MDNMEKSLLIAITDRLEHFLIETIGYYQIVGKSLSHKKEILDQIESLSGLIADVRNDIGKELNELIERIH